MNIWTVRDMIFIVVIIFNAGISIGIYVNHIRHIKGDLQKLRHDLDMLHRTVNKNAERLSRMEGISNERKK